MTEQLREQIWKRLEVDLIGPSAPDELIGDRPSDRYMTGILYPQETEIADEDDDELKGGGGDQEAGAPVVVDEGVPLVATLKPASAGISFCVEGPEDEDPGVNIIVRCGTYRARETQDKQEWQRHDHVASLSAEKLAFGHRKVDLSDQGLPKLEVYFQVARWDNGRRTVTIALVNRHLKGGTRSESEERSFFQAQLEVVPESGTRLVARPSRIVALDEDTKAAELIYRHARELATGHTCAASWDGDGETASAVRTTWLPRATVPAVNPSGNAVFEHLREGTNRLSAEWLADAARADLREALADLVSSYRDWIHQQETEIPNLASDYQQQAGVHVKRCAEGADRMESAVLLIDSDANVRRAFQLAQKAMWMQRAWSARKREEDAAPPTELAWRPFQLGFQLLVLSSLANRDHANRDVMDLLWFPTGGGKTEAYLALTAFLLFFRRLRAEGADDGAGVAVIMRYTLRLLTVQQFQRAAAMVCACETLRRSATDQALRSMFFSIGLWVGNSATPAKVSDAYKSSSTTTHRQLTACPCCKGKLDWAGRQNQSEFSCAGERPCEIRDGGSHVPVYTIDEDIYRVAPSLLLATVDKFAQIVRKAETGRFFAINSDRHPPDLIIQDELHLISGPLGTMTGLYETAIDELCSHRGHKPKIIGSTATIRRATEQIRGLFARQTYQFPPPGIDAADSGFAVLDSSRPGRLYVGLTTAGRSAKFAVQAVAASLLQAAAGLTATPEDRDPYWTLVGYFNTLRELGGSLVLMQDDVPVSIEQYASRHGEAPRVIAPPSELTSRVGSTEIRKMLDELEIPCGTAGANDVLLASNMISVGIDIPRLGMMMVVGQPKTISEYIQATSRVGRSRPGIVVALYNASRARDRARFETFRTWHDTIYREVEATSVTPFASRAQDRALHGVLVALVRHLVPGMQSDPPVLMPSSRSAADKLVAKVEARVLRCDHKELKQVGDGLRARLAQWEGESGLQKYWDDYGKKKSLLMSAEQHAASMQSGKFTSRALWPTPNSMREVEPSTPFILVNKLTERNS